MSVNITATSRRSNRSPTAPPSTHPGALGHPHATTITPVRPMATRTADEAHQRRGRLLLRAAGSFLQERQNRLLRHRSVAGVRNHAKLRTRDRPEHLDSVFRHDDVAVADDEECGRLDALQLLVREARLSGPHEFQTSENDGPVFWTVGRETR